MQPDGVASLDCFDEALHASWRDLVHGKVRLGNLKRYKTVSAWGRLLKFLFVCFLRCSCIMVSLALAAPGIRTAWHRP